MAIALDAATTSAVSTGATLTWAHTVGVGDNRLLVVGIVTRADSGTPTCTGVTYNGVSMGKARADNSSAGPHPESSVWLLHNPDSGAHNIVASFTGNSHAGGVSCSYTGAYQSSTADAVGGQTGTTSGSKTFTVTIVADNCWIFAVGINTGFSPTIAVQQTSRGSLTLSSGAVMAAEDTNAAQTPPGAKTMGFTLGGTVVVAWAMTGASFAPAAAAAIRACQVIIV